MEAAKTGFAPAMTRLGDCNRNGEGTSRSEIDALKWYRDALSAGDTAARARLTEMGKTE
jgi:TPR repeat protein